MNHPLTFSPFRKSSDMCGGFAEAIRAPLCAEAAERKQSTL